MFIDSLEFLSFDTERLSKVMNNRSMNQSVAFQNWVAANFLLNFARRRQLGENAPERKADWAPRGSSSFSKLRSRILERESTVIQDFKKLQFFGFSKKILKNHFFRKKFQNI